MPLSHETIDARLAGGPWRRQAATIVLDRELPDFAAAVAYVNRVAELAEQAGHHPDILLHGFRRVRLTLSTHSAGGTVTEADLALARRIDELT